MSLTSLEEALNLSEKEVKKLHKKYLNPALVSMMSLINFDRMYSYAQGSIIKNKDGQEFIDFLGGYGSVNMGHNHPHIYGAIEKVKNRPNILQASLSSFSGVLAKNLAEITPGNLQRSFFCNSGAEAVEGALKLAKIATKKEKIVYCEGSFHGKTLGALSVTGRVKYRKHFQPLVPGTIEVPFGDSTALEKVLANNNVAAFIVECIQGEGGINIPSDNYLQNAKDLCRKYNTLLVIDEIQSGLGRTGKMFACEHYNVEPDIMCMAKSLGGGIVPLGAYITSEKIHNQAYGKLEKALLHTSTFGGNTYAMAAGIAALEVLEKEQLVEKARDHGEYLINKLQEMQKKYQIINDVRGKGLMIGLEIQGNKNSLVNKISGGKLDNLTNEYFAALVAGKLLEKYNIITAYTLNNPNVIRIEPPLNISLEHIDRLINSLEEIFSSNIGFLKLALGSTKNII